MILKPRRHLEIARVLFAMAVCFQGLQMIQNGASIYSPFLHAWRRMLVPDSKNKINENLTWEFINIQIIKAMGSLMISGGLLILANLLRIGGTAVMIVLSFLVLTQDNPLIEGFIKP